MRTTEKLFAQLRTHKDTRWLTVWVAGLLCIVLWDLAFLNRPAFMKIIQGFWNTMAIAFLVTLCTLLFAWVATNLLHTLTMRTMRVPYLTLSFALNLLRSVPQIVGVLLFYVLVASLVQKGSLSSSAAIAPFMAVGMGLFIFLELTDLMRERIDHFRRLDFYNAMRVCGVQEKRIVNFDILWKNSRVHILNKLIAVFGMAVFLQCSVDFIISVGLSNNVNAVNLPSTLGSLLAKIDSKQDILALGYTLTHPSYAAHLPFTHLLGLTVAFLIVFTLLCMHHIANGFAEGHRL